MALLPPAARPLRDLGRRALSTIHAAWGDAGPLATEHMLFDGGGGFDEERGAPRLAVVLHGLLGQGRNLRTFATDLFRGVVERSDATWTVVFADLRCHGKTAASEPPLPPPYTLAAASEPPLAPPHTLAAAAGDVIETVRRNWPEGRIDALIGHSLGGKVALEVTKQLGSDSNGAGPPAQVWCLDSVPGVVAEPHKGTTGEVLHVLDTVAGVPVPLPSREALFEALNARDHTNKAFQQWLASNLVLKGKGRYEWAFDVTGARELFDSYLASSYWDLLAAPPGHTEIHVVKAMKGGRWKGGLADELAAAAAASGGRTQTHEMRAGHWLHSEDPKGLAELLRPHILRIQ